MHEGATDDAVKSLFSLLELAEDRACAADELSNFARMPPQPPGIRLQSVLCDVGIALVPTSVYGAYNFKECRQSFFDGLAMRVAARRVFSSASATRPARIAVVGCGGWTQGWHLPNLANRADAEIAALVEPADEPGAGGCLSGRLESMATLEAKYGAPRYHSLAALLAERRSELDGVLVAAPHTLHCALGKEVLDAGLHLLMEKPMTTDVAEARTLVDAGAAAPQLALLLNNTANWQPGFIEARSHVRERGSIGEVRHVSCLLAAPLSWLFEGHDHAGWTQPTGTMVGNGFGWGQLSHTFAWVYGATGLTPSTVYAAAVHSAATGADVYDAATITCTNGALINASGVGTIPDAGFKVVANWVFGTEGMMHFGGLAGSDGAAPDSSGDGSAAAEEMAALARQQAQGARLQVHLAPAAHSLAAPRRPPGQHHLI